MNHPAQGHTYGPEVKEGIVEMVERSARSSYGFVCFDDGKAFVSGKLINRESGFKDIFIKGAQVVCLIAPKPGKKYPNVTRIDSVKSK